MDTEAPKQDWAVTIAMRAEQKPPAKELPTECSFCGSPRIFVGSGNVKCRDCKKVDILQKSPAFEDIGYAGGSEAESQFNNLLIEQGERKLVQS